MHSPLKGAVVSFCQICYLTVTAIWIRFQVTYKCRKGWWFSGPQRKSVTCSPKGEWEPSPLNVSLLGCNNLTKTIRVFDALDFWRSQGGKEDHGPLKFLAYLVVLCSVRLCPQIKYCCSPEVKTFRPPKFWAGYVTALDWPLPLCFQLTCDDVTCAPNPSIHADLSGSHSYGSSVVVTCPTGYELFNGQDVPLRVTCNELGEWEPAFGGKKQTV